MFSSTLLLKDDTAAVKAALHAMAILQVQQANALKQLDEGRHVLAVVQVLCIITDFALQVTPRKLGHTISTLVVQERPLWFNLAQIRDAEKICFLDMPIAQGGLFGDNVKDFSQQFSSVKKQTKTL